MPANRISVPPIGGRLAPPASAKKVIYRRPNYSRPGLAEKQLRNRATIGRITVEFEKILAEVTTICEAVVEDMANRAERMAKARAPVRRVFKGSRNTIQTMSLREALQVSRGFINSLSTEEYRKHIEKGGQFPPTRRFVSSSGSNTWSNTRMYRQLKMVNGSLRWGGLGSSEKYLFGEFDKRSRTFSGGQLTAEGRYALSHAKLQAFTDAAGRRSLVDVGRGAVNVKQASLGENLEITPDTEITLGGSLRDSIHVESVDVGDNIIMSEVVAGSPRVYYARYMEFGTRHVAARPFLRPALKHIEGVFPSRLRERLSKVGR